MGNQWLNTFIPLWRKIFHFNMDARVLWSGQALQAIRYALQYAMKRQNVLDNVAVVELAFKKRIQREAILSTTEYGLGLGRLLSLSHCTSGTMEIGGPLATAIIMEGGAVTFGCTFERLVLVEGLNLLNNEQVEAMVVSRGDQLYTETSIVKYMERPKCLEHYCWYDYCRWFERTDQTPTRQDRSCSFSDRAPAAMRRHLQTHSIRYHEYPRVPDIIGPRLPDASRLTNDDYEVKTELYYRMALLL
jgi:hypothetical protein